MKKVSLTNSQLIRVTTPADNLKQAPNVVTIATNPVIHSSTGVRVVNVQSNVICNTYMQRKFYQDIYGDIFKLLMRLPDKAIQQRVIDAINGRTASDKSSVIANPNQCKHCSNNKSEKPQKVDAFTQTEILVTKETKETKVKCIDEKDVKPPVKKEYSGTKQTDTAEDKLEDGKKSTDVPKNVPRKRGRKRNTCVPQVVKQSAAQMALQEREDKQLTPLPPTKKKKVETSQPSKIASPIKNSGRIERRDSAQSCLSGVDINEVSTVVENYINNDKQQIIRVTMTKEYITSNIMSKEGLLPIHDAILVGDVRKLQRQIYVWTKLKENIDINTVLSADYEDCLQLAVTNDCRPEIVKIILTAGVLPNHIYEDSNTALHLAVINEIQLESLRELMLCIDLDLLEKTNDDGYTALHIAVRHNRYKMAEIICDTIDQRQLKEPIYKRTEDLGDADKDCSGSGNKNVVLKDDKKFAKFYERACDRLEHNKEKLLSSALKRRLLNAEDALAGNTCLFYAVQDELEHLCYFLLAHLGNPDEENRSGHSPKSFHYEYARILRINLKIARVMDKVIGILNGKTS